MSGSSVSIDPFQGIIQDVSKQYPRLGRIMGQSIIGYADPPPGEEGNVMEFYAPWESSNPHFGKTYLEVYDKNIKGDDLRDLLAADTLHYLGGTTPQGVPVDPNWKKLRDKFYSSMTDDQNRMNREAYEDEMKDNKGQVIPFYDWMNQSRIDAFLRGGLFPGVNPEWQKEGIYTEDQRKILNEMRKYISQ